VSTAFTELDVVVKNDGDKGGRRAHVASRHDRAVHERSRQTDR
jgi:hypothetical protein